MKALTESLALFMPPLWLAAAAAALAAAGLLVAFVDTLHENARRGETLRQWQRTGPVRHAVVTSAATVPGGEAQSSAAAMSPTFQR